MDGKVLYLDIIKIRIEGREEERDNTERECNRANGAENRVKELETLIAKVVE